MKKFIYVNFVKVILIGTMVISYMAPAHALSPKGKAILTMAVYGTVGGALLGTSMFLAIGGTSRSIFQGASLGLYAGLLFGAYVVGSHAMKKFKWNKDSGKDDYYGPPMGSGGTSAPAGDDYYRHINHSFEPTFRRDLPGKKNYKNMPLFYINLINYQF
ncbi:MAG: hypothetical protein ISR65_06470 [Bacteriovoracaceae bacterium]|nr:hypothetical protein [Bacteriovoracaceae bacterium]